MHADRQLTTEVKIPFLPSIAGLLQRKCACGTHIMGGGQCAECKKKQVNGKPLQTKLAIGEPGDAHEQESDRVAEQVMRMPAYDLDKKRNGNMPQVQRRASGGASGLAEAPPVVHKVLNSPGQPLDASTRAFFEPRFGHDFSRVRVHSGAAAEQSARDVNANAYTVGHNVVFGAGQFAPGAHEGRCLIAHELAHVVQQRKTPQSIIHTQLALGDTNDQTEHEANLVEQAVLPIAGLPQESPALGDIVPGSLIHPLLQRAIKTVPTWAGEFLLDEYDPTQGEDNPDVNGATITMRFHPNEFVDAEQIAFVQRVRNLVDEKPYTKDYRNEAQQKVAESRNIPRGEVGHGSHIDQMPYSRTPVGGMKRESGDTLANPEPNPTSTHIGFHFTDADGTLKKDDAMLHDEPNLVEKPDIEQAQEFETAALAIKGKQQGVYYGSVEWGWFKYPSQKHAQLSEFKVKSKDAPSAVFEKAAMFWNASVTSDKKDAIHVPSMRMYLTSVATKLWDAPGKGKEIGRLGKNVRVGLTDEREPKNPAFWLNVVVVSGPLAGKRGWVTGTLLTPENGRGKPGK